MGVAVLCWLVLWLCHQGEVVLADPSSTGDSATSCTLIPDSNIHNAWEWALDASPKATGMIVYQNGIKRFEEYEIKNVCRWFCWSKVLRFIVLDIFGWYRHGGSASRPFSMFSLTKSIAGMAAVLLDVSLETTASTYISEWQGDTDKSSITIGELVKLSSGIDSAPRGPRSVRYDDAIQAEFIGKQFRYGAEPFTVFSKLIELASGKDTKEYLDDNLFDPLGISVSISRTNDDEDVVVLSSGGSATLPDIAKLGLELLAATKGTGQVFDNSDITTLTTPGLNPTYGLGFWLNDAGTDIDGTNSVTETYPACGPTAVFHGQGAGGQLLTIVPEQELVIVKSAAAPVAGAGGVQQSQEFWSLLFAGQNCQCSP